MGDLIYIPFYPQFNMDMAVCQNLVPLVNIKIAGKWMFIPLKMVLIGIDPYPYVEPDIFFLRFGSKWLGGFLLTCFPTFQDLSGGHFPSPVRTEGDFLFQIIFLVGGLEHEFYFSISYMGCHPSH